MADFDKIFNMLMKIEGGYVKNKYDRGGETKYGITGKLAEHYGYDVKHLTLEEAKTIYKKEFWENSNIELIRNNLLAFSIFSFYINTGNKKLAIKLLQRSYNLLNKNIIKEDGILGPITANSINNYRYYKVLFKTYNIFISMYYIAITENNNNLLRDLKEHKETSGSISNKHFIRGWLEKRIFDFLKK